MVLGATRFYQCFSVDFAEVNVRYLLPPMTAGVVLSNVAVRCRAFSSSICRSGFSASKAVDGITVNTRSDGWGSIFQTAFTGDPTPWLSLDLGTTSLISRIILFNRQDCCGSRLMNAELRIGMVSITSIGDSASISSNAVVWRQPAGVVGITGARYTINLATAVLGRWVILQNYHPRGETVGEWICAH